MTDDKRSDPKRVWVISKGRYTAADALRIPDAGLPQSVMVYEISALARYLLNPNPIRIQKKLVGCELFLQPDARPFFKRIRGRLRRFGADRDAELRSERLEAASDIYEPHMADLRLEAYLERICELLRPHDPLLRRLSKTDMGQIAEVRGLCREIGGGTSYLNLQGGISEKFGYIGDFLHREVAITLEKANIAEGLFEMQGFDFKSYDARQAYQLIKFTADGKQKACVLDTNNRFEFWLADIKLIHFIQLFEQLLHANFQLKRSLAQCTAGKAEPSKLFFNPDFKIDYSDGRLPRLYQDMLARQHIPPLQKGVLQNVLNQSQLGVTFNFIPESEADSGKLFVNLSVMHNTRALEPLRADLPQLYAEIQKRAALTEAGRYYLLDSFRGYQDGQ